MAKSSKNRKKRSNKLHLSENELILAKLEEIEKKGSEESGAAGSLKMWYLRNKFWTPKQLGYAKTIIFKSSKPRRKIKPKKHYLYAIHDGTDIKLGYSGDISKRIKAMQTGNAKPLKCVWKYYTGHDQGQAIKLERKLHRLCKQHRITGEWFRYQCMSLVENFSAG